MPTLRFRQNEIVEGSIRYVTVEFFDRTDAPATPSALRYRVDCLTNQREVVGWTDLVAAQTATFIVTADQNRILNDQNLAEDRQIVVEATGSDGPIRVDATYRIRNLLNVT